MGQVHSHVLILHGKIWNVLNELMGKKNKSTPAFVEADGKFLTQSKDIADYLSNYFDKLV